MSRRDLGRKSLLLFGSAWGGQALGMLASLLIARWLGPAALGAIGFTTGLAGLVMAALLPGFGQAHLKRLAEGQDAGRCLGTMLAIQATLAGLLLAALWVTWLAGGFFESPELTAVFLFMLAAQISSSFADTFLRVFVAREWVVPHAIILLAGRLCRLVATVLVLAWVPSIAWVAGTFPIEGVVTGGAAAAVLASRHGIRAGRPSRQSLLGYWRYARPFLVTTPIAMLQDSVDRVIVGRWAGLAAAGYYHVARALWEALHSVMAAPGTFLFTRLSSLYAERSSARDREARTLFWSALDKLLFVSVPLAFGFWALAEPLIEALYGEAFRPAATALRILVMAAVVATVVNPYTHIVYALDQGDRFVTVNLVRLVAYLAALFALVPAAPVLGSVTGLWPGDPGAALARLFLISFPAWVYFVWTRDLAGIPFYPPAWVYLGGFGLMVVAHDGLLRLAGSLGARGLGASLGAAAVTLFLYLAYLLRLHRGTRENLRYVSALLSPRSFGAFLKAGLSREEST